MMQKVVKKDTKLLKLRERNVVVLNEKKQKKRDVVEKKVKQEVLFIEN